MNIWGLSAYLDGAFPDVQGTNSIGTDTPPYHQTFEKRVDNFPLSSRGCSVCVSQKEFQIWIYLTTEQFSALPQSILNAL